MWAPEHSAFSPLPLPDPAPRLGLLLDRCGHEDGLALEQRLVEGAAAGAALAAVWEPEPSLVVPGSYRRFERFGALCERFAERGWPVWLRRSGGGLVPQGPGMLNLSLAWRTACAMGDAMEPVYGWLCRLLQEAIGPFGLSVQPQAVDGSFCDGRYNLALHGRKVVGTAQYWRRVSASEHVVLAHACVLVEADLLTLVHRANEFEARLGSDRQYHAGAVINLVQALQPVPVDADGVALSARALAQRLQQAACAAQVPC